MVGIGNGEEGDGTQCDMGDDGAETAAFKMSCLLSLLLVKWVDILQFVSGSFVFVLLLLCVVVCCEDVTLLFSRGWKCVELFCCCWPDILLLLLLLLPPPPPLLFVLLLLLLQLLDNALEFVLPRLDLVVETVGCDVVRSSKSKIFLLNVCCSSPLPAAAAAVAPVT